MPDTGLLFVYGETGDKVSTDEFNDWYNTEHAPLRLTVPGFHNAQRYEATDGASPRWLALYDLHTPAVASSPAYTGLAASASAREKALIPRLADLNRSIFQLLSTTTADSVTTTPDSTSTPDAAAATDTPTPTTTATTNTATTTAAPAPFVLVVSILADASVEAELNQWYADEHLALLSRVPGLVRIRRYKLLSRAQLAGESSAVAAGESSAVAAGGPVHNSPTGPDRNSLAGDSPTATQSLTTTTTTTTNSPAPPVHNYLTLFDVTRDDFSALPEFARAAETEWAGRLLPRLGGLSIRRFRLHTVVAKPAA